MRWYTGWDSSQTQPIDEANDPRARSMGGKKRFEANRLGFEKRPEGFRNDLVARYRITHGKLDRIEQLFGAERL